MAMTDIIELVSMLDRPDGLMPSLPDRFCSSDTMYQAWLGVFGQEKRLKKMADAIRRSDALQMITRRGYNVAKQKDAELMTVFYGMEPLRGWMDEYIRSDNPRAPTLVSSLPWLINVLISVCPEKITDSKMVFEVEDAFDDDFSRKAQHLLNALGAEPFYASLSEQHQDMADLALNLILDQSPPGSILKLFELAPWLAERQSRFLDVVKSRIEAEDPKEIEAEEHIKSFEKGIRTLYENAVDYRKKRSISGYLSVRSALKELMGLQIQHGSTSFGHSLAYEYQEMIKLFLNVGEVFTRLKIAEGQAIWGPLVTAAESLPKISRIDADSDEQIKALETFLNGRRSITRDNQQAFSDLHDSTDMLDQSMTRLAKITQSQDGGLDEILALNQQLVESKAKAIESVKIVAPLGKELIALLNTLSAELNRLQNAPKVDHAQLARNLEIELSQVKQSNLDHLSHIEAISNEKTQLEQALEREKARRMAQEEAASIAKKEAHELRTAMANVGRAPAYHTAVKGPLEPCDVVGLMSGTIKLTPEYILQVFQKLYPNELVILESAIKSAKDAYNFELGSRLVTLMQSLVDYNQAIREGKSDSEARLILGSSYASNESDSVTKNTKLRAQREFTYEGDTVAFLAHVGIGKGYGTQHVIRIHFKVIDGRVVIAYCGERLDTTTTS